MNLMKTDPSYEQFLESNGSMVVQLYERVEASALWFKDLQGKLLRNGFEQNPYDHCVYNKVGEDGKQITIVVHVDDLLVTSENRLHIDAFGVYLKSVYPETKTNTGSILDYVGMTFNLNEERQVKVTMDNCVEDILSGCGVETTKVTPAASTLFDVRDSPRATEQEAKWFHTKVLYLAKRVRNV